MFKKIPHWLWMTLLYLGTHVPLLLALPIFADEAIYLHWAQLCQDDLVRFAFFSMADGKPPLFIWLLALTLKLGSDPLLIGRLTAVGIGLLTVYVIGQLSLLLTGNRRVQTIAMLLTTLLPFWWMYHRMALMDGLLTLCITTSFYFAIRIAKRCQASSAIAYDTIPYVLLLGLSFGGALMTKTPALFAIPVIALTPLFALIRHRTHHRPIRARLIESTILIGVGGFIGFVFFALLRVSPFFGALFARSGDFTFSVQEVLRGEWRFVLFSSLPREIGWISHYLTPASMLALLIGLWYPKTRKQVAVLTLAALVYAAPLIAVGRVLYPRYFLPVAPFLTIAAAIGFSELVSRRKTRMIATFLAAVCLFQSAQMIIPGMFQIERMPLTAIDRMQYLEEWSAGFGTSEIRDFIRARYLAVGASTRIIVLTEGSFGTLPDGLSIYFFGKNQLDGVEIHGIGVGPSVLPAEYLSLKNAEVYYVVNSHRFRIADQASLEKIFSVPRPNNAPSVLFYRVRRQ